MTTLSDTFLPNFIDSHSAPCVLLALVANARTLAAKPITPYNRAKPIAKLLELPTSQWTTSPTSTFLNLRCPKFPSLVHSAMVIMAATAQGLLSTPIDKSTRMVLIAPSPKPFQPRFSFYDMYGNAYDNVSVLRPCYLEILLMHSSSVSFMHILQHA